MVSHVQIIKWTLNQLIYLLMNQEKAVVGIDLGTTTSCAFVQQNGGLKNIVHEQEHNTIDSVIKITPEGACILSVNTAARAAQLKGKGCVYEAKRLIGRKYAEVENEVKKNQWPFEVFEGDDGYAAIRVTLRYRGSDGKYMEEKRELYPEEVGAYILRDLKERAEKLLDVPADSCVIGCPVDFSFDQRKKTVEAAVLAGFTLDSISLYPESTLAAIAYAEEYDKEATKPRVYLVYDFGGGAFSASIVKREENAYRTIATEGDENCGGKDIDVRVMSVIREDLKDEDYEINENRISRMKFACKQMKELLLTNLSYEMCCDFVILRNEDEDDYPVKRMTSAAVDAIAKPVIERTIKLVKKLLDESSYTVDDIDYVFMMGGSSKLNGVRVSLERVFGSEKVKCDTADLCEAAIAKGAVLMGLSKKWVVTEVSKEITGSEIVSLHPVEDLMTSSATSQTTDNEVKEVPKAFIDAAVPAPIDVLMASSVTKTPYDPNQVIPPIVKPNVPRPIVDKMPYSVVIKTADGEVELVPKGELMNHEFFKYVFPSSTSNSAVIEFEVRDSDSLRSVGCINIPIVSQKDVKAQPLRVEARMESSERMNVYVKKEVDPIVDYTVTINLSMNEEEIAAATRQSIVFIEEQNKRTAMQELRTAIQTIYDEERYGGKLKEQEKRKKWQKVVNQSKQCNSVEELEALKETIEKMKSELCDSA